MKSRFSKFLFLITILSLIIITLVFIGGLLQKRKGNENNNSQDKSILGEQTGIIGSVPTTASSLNVLVQNTLDNTKETVTKQVVEVEKTILKNIEKEVSDLTKSQIDTLKRQVCTDWGVITPLPSLTP